jgi:RNA polymerase sigma-70 factor (ECF subfamily)
MTRPIDPHGAPIAEAGLPSDAQLVNAVRNGDQQALARIYDRYADRVLGLALRIVRSRPEAEAVVSDVFLEIWRRPDRFNQSLGEFRPYLLLLTRSRAIDRLRAAKTRAEKTRQAAAQLGHWAHDEDPVSSPTVAVIAMERQRLVRDAVASLDEDQRAPLMLSFFEGLSHREVADRLGQPLGTVKTRIRAALHKLRHRLSSAERSDGLS